MDVDQCYLLGQIRKAHGLQGEMKAYFDVDQIEDYEDLESVYLLKEDKLTPFSMRGFRQIGPNLALIKLKDVFHREAAKDLFGVDMFLPLEKLPELSADHQFYYHDVIGFKIMDKNAGEMGTVKGFRDMPHVDLLIMEYQEKEILIPMNRDIVFNADLEQKTIQTDLPEGLVEVFLD